MQEVVFTLETVKGRTWLQITFHTSKQLLESNFFKGN